MNENTLKIATAGVFAVVGAYFRQLTFPLVLLFMMMICDYISGMMRAWIKGELSSRVGIKGIVKKALYLCIVCVAIAADWVVQIATRELGINFDGAYFCALLVTIWLILNECISILENVAEIGGPVPPFLVKLVAKLKQTAEDGAESAKKGGGAK